MSLATNVRTRREALGLTRTELGAKSGISYAYVKSIELGRRSGIRVEIGYGLANALGCTLDDLYKDELKKEGTA